jgi:hypothetical protein
MKYAASVVEVFGAALVVAGIWLWSSPAALVVAGLFLIAAASTASAPGEAPRVATVRTGRRPRRVA